MSAEKLTPVQQAFRELKEGATIPEITITVGGKKQKLTDVSIVHTGTGDRGFYVRTETAHLHNERVIFESDVTNMRVLQSRFRLRTSF